MKTAKFEWWNDLQCKRGCSTYLEPTHPFLLEGFHLKPLSQVPWILSTTEWTQFLLITTFYNKINNSNHNYAWHFTEIIKNYSNFHEREKKTLTAKWRKKPHNSFWIKAWLKSIIGKQVILSFQQLSILGLTAANISFTLTGFTINFGIIKTSVIQLMKWSP